MLRPSRLAAYMAVSASSRSSSAVWSAVPRRTPMLARAWTYRESRRMCSPRTSRALRATCIAVSMVAPGRRIANSSPPSRATTSLSRTTLLRREATSCSTRSPASWPKRSLTFLKLSRSRSSSAGGGVPRAAWLRASSMASIRATRLARPVRASDIAIFIMSRCAWRSMAVRLSTRFSNCS
jgi:hypothetical protein